MKEEAIARFDYPEERNRILLKSARSHVHFISKELSRHKFSFVRQSDLFHGLLTDSFT